MYSSRGNNAYGQQQQQQQQTKPQPYSSHLGPDGASQISMASRHPALLGGHSSAGAHYGGQYTSVYGSAALNSALQVPATSAKGAGSSVFEGRSGYGSTMQDSPKYTSENYLAANQKYGSKGEKMFSDDRLTYAERSSAYSGRDLQTESTVRLADSLAFGHPHQTDIYDRLDAASALRKELLDGSSRQGDYLAARAATVRQELLPYGARMDAADLHTLSMISGTQHPPSILGAAPRRDMEDLVYTHTSATPGYGVSLPPGRAYASAKSLHGTSLDSDYPGGILARAGYARLDDRKDDVEYAREIERREEDRRREILRDRERDRERDRDRERERQRERDRERDRERERERERRREHERELERREKEREAKRGSEIRRDRSPLRSSRDRGRSSSAKARRSLRRESPVKEKRREYVCKVYSSNLVDPERDYLSMDKRYPRLYVSPECSKVVVNCSREDLKIPFNTPISFEHDFVQEEIPSEPDSASKKISDGHEKLESGATRWNAKMLLMSGLSHNAWEELSSERKYEDRIPHLCNMLRFAFLKDGSSCMAIGGSWDTVDGNDPTVDKSILVQTVLRYAKEVTGLDLKNCRHWNPFLEIHYDRVGKDGLFSHKEVTVLYIPDLSDCLPSIDAWRDQWLAHKMAIAERERLHALKREKLREKKEVPKDKETKDLKKPEKKKEAGSAAKVNGKGKVGTKVKAKEAGKEGDKTVLEKKDGDKTIIEKKDGDKTIIEKKDGDKTAIENNDEVETADEGNKPGKKNLTDHTDVQTPGSGKKIIRKVIKKKVVAEKDGAGNTEVIGEDAESSATSTKKKAIKKAPVVKTVKKEDEVKEPKCSDVKEKNEDVVGASVKTTVKKKIIKRVAKKKIAAKDFNNKDKVANENETGLAIGKQTASEVKLEKNELVSEAVPHYVVPEQRKDVGGSSEVGNKSEKIQVKEEKKAKVEGSGSDKKAKSKDVKEKKDEDVKTETRVKDVKDKKKTEDPPRHPGLILQTKGSKYSKLRSLSLSLDSLLDYTDKDIEESTFELSVFAETFYEMLQYLMGSRILKFLQKLRIKFVTKRNQKKRQREEVSDKKEKGKEKTSGKKSPPKRQKTEDATVESKSVKTETIQEGDPTDEKTVKDEKMLIDNLENPKPEDGSENDEDPEEEVEEVVEEEEVEEEAEEEEEEEEEEEDPEEDPEEDENMADANPLNDVENEEKAEVEKKVNMDEKSENVDEKVKDGQEEKAKVTVDPDIKSEAEKKKKKENRKVDTKKKETQLDKQLLEAFRFFDRNRVGYIRVEDLRLILHALGNCMSHRDAKELVQSALLESNTGRDDRILYNKLVKMNDI